METSVFKEPRSEEAELLKKLFEQLEEAKRRCGHFTVKAGSRLEGDDLAVGYEPISHQVRFLFDAAFDYISVLQRVMEHKVPAVGAYPLIRAALESAAQVLWLTTAETREERVRRMLCQVWEAENLSDKALNKLDPQHQSGLQEVRTKIEKHSNQTDLRRCRVTTTHIMTEAGNYVQVRVFKPIDVWNVCSSLAHGNQSMARVVLEIQPEGPSDSLSDGTSATTRYRVLLVFVDVLKKVIDAALNKRDELNLPQPVSPDSQSGEHRGVDRDRQQAE